MGECVLVGREAGDENGASGHVGGPCRNIGAGVRTLDTGFGSTAGAGIGFEINGAAGGAGFGMD